MGFESRANAERLLHNLQPRLNQFGLTRPHTFAFLGFTHCSGWTSDGRLIVKHKTQSKRITES